MSSNLQALPEAFHTFLPCSSVEPSVCRPFRGVKRKAVDSRSCVARRTGEWSQIQGGGLCKYCEFSMLSKVRPWRVRTPTLGREFDRFPYRASVHPVL